jgi:DNA-binding response OmpR family regulator
MRILVIEDEPRMLQLLQQGLRERGCAVMAARDGRSGLEIADVCTFDAIVLDIGLPGIDGYEIIRTLKERRLQTPILALTARDAEDDIIRGLDLGADDYMTKPFSFPELAARLQCIGRTQSYIDPSQIQVGDLIIDISRHSVTRGNTMLDLTRTEFLLLACLARHAGQCVSRQTLMDNVWGAGHEIGSGALDVLVNALRSKVDAPWRNKLIGTVRGLGYILRHHSAADGSAR